jgi:hypothetical protein
MIPFINLELAARDTSSSEIFPSKIEESKI